MNLAATVSSFLFLAASSVASNGEGEDNLFIRGNGVARATRKITGNGSSGTRPRKRTRTHGRTKKMNPCQKTVDFWTSEKIKFACAKPLHLSLDDDKDINGDSRNDIDNGKDKGKGKNKEKDKGKNKENDKRKDKDKGKDKEKGKDKDKGKGKRNGKLRNLKTTVVDDPWEQGGDVLQAAGRLLFQMNGSYSSCSATAVTDGSTTNGRSIIVTAAHCVFNDSTKEFASYFMFIPNQDDGGFDSSDLNCNNDKFGCWTPSFAVVDNEWASKSWSSNIPADYAFLVVNDVNNHRGPSDVSDVLDKAVPALDVSFAVPTYGAVAHGLGYSGNRDPDFRYCAQDLDYYPSRGGYILNGCGLTGGSSGGPWIQTFDGNKRGAVIAVNSYGPGGPGYMGGPKLHNNSAKCLFEKAMSVPEYDAGGNGIVVTYKGNCKDSNYVSGTEFSGGGGECAACSPYQDTYDQACCDYFGDNEYYATYVSWRGTIYCGRCS